MLENIKHGKDLIHFIFKSLDESSPPLIKYENNITIQWGQNNCTERSCNLMWKSCVSVKRNIIGQF